MTAPLGRAGRNLPAGRITKRGALRLALDPRPATSEYDGMTIKALKTLLVDAGVDVPAGRPTQGDLVAIAEREVG